VKPSYLILSGDGADLTFIDPTLRQTAAQHGVNCQWVSAKDVRNGVLQDPNALMLVLPGGRSGQEMREALADDGATNIVSAIHDGMGALGICRGGYLLGKKIEYAKEEPGHEKRVFSPLGVFNATVKGELPFLPYEKEGPLRGWHRAALTNVGFGHKREAQLFYWGGGMLLPEGGKPTKDMLVLARYNSLPGRPIAIAAQRVGQGVAIFAGVHTEVSGRALIKSDNSQLTELDPNDGGAWRYQLAIGLHANEAARQHLWDSKMSILQLAQRVRGKTRAAQPT